ncbi:MAG: HD domain-containing protein [Mariprofundaceae bacterium]|nr:HD domain-containing protein [Mariprofundaceae bacterium]
MACRTSDDDHINNLEKLNPTLLPDAVIRLCRQLKSLGGSAWLVGGAVRDLTLGIPLKDIDIEVFGLDAELLNSHLQEIGRTEHVGKQFGVTKFWTQGHEIDISLPRTEKKTALGHRGFDVIPDPDISPETASLRRDFTINAMMYDPIENRLLDFHHGRDDLAQRILRHVSPAFAEDPLRVLRGMQFAARFSLTMDPETTELCRSLLAEAETLPISRIWCEWQKWACSDHPSYGLRALRESGWIRLYPELEALLDCPQDPAWHPEGDVWGHTCQVVDQAARITTRYRWGSEIRELMLFSALCHDLGKPPCTITDEKGIIRSPGHSREGKAHTSSLLKRIGAPKRLEQFLLPLVQEHMTHLHGEPTPRAIRHLAARLDPASIELWEALVEADASGRAPSPASRPAQSWLQQAELMTYEQQKPAPIVTGKLLQELGVQPGIKMGELIDTAYQAQLDGAFDNRKKAVLWCMQRDNNCMPENSLKTE